VASDETPAAADPDDVLGTKPPPLGIKPMGLAPIATPPRWILITSSLRSRDLHATAKSHGGDRGASLIIEVAPVFGIAWQRTGKNGGEPRKSTLGLSIAAWGRETTPPRRRLLTISGGSIAGFVGFGPTDESTGIRVAVPALASVVIDAGRKVQPNDGIFGAMLLSLYFAWEGRK
jgi:hypothetical protein